MNARRERECVRVCVKKEENGRDERERERGERVLLLFVDAVNFLHHSISATQERMLVVFRRY